MKREFANRLKELRVEKGLSIQSLSKILKIGTASISRWESGQQDIKSDYLQMLADYFQVSTDYLLGRTD